MTKTVRCHQCGMTYDATSKSDLRRHNDFHTEWCGFLKAFDLPNDFGRVLEQIELEYVMLKDIESTSKLSDEVLRTKVVRWCSLKYRLYYLLRTAEGGTKMLSKEKYCQELLDVNRKTFGERAYTLGRSWLGVKVCA